MEGLRANYEPVQQPGHVAQYHCQVCRARLIIAANADDKASGPQLFDASRIEESFIYLDDKRGGPGPPRGMDGSFVLLPNRPPAGAGRLAGGSTAGGTGHSTPGGAQPSQEGAPGLDAKLQALSELFDQASTDMQVDHPLCLDCASQLKDEIEAQIQDAEQEIAAYAAAVEGLSAGKQEALPDEVFKQEMARLEAAQETQREAARQAEEELESLRRDLSALHAAAADLDVLEERYWHDYNEFQQLLKVHVEERDALLAKISAVNQRKQVLQATNVYNDAFKIWHDGPFATISGFRLGRTNDSPVEWDEINAAWGQAVLLLHVMAQNCGITFSAARLIPMGSHPRIADKRHTYDLFGPVQRMWSSDYDKAMTSYLACLKEFGEYAAEIDKTLPGERTFEGFPFAIEGDRINHHTIKHTLANLDKWTKALKFMLANLKKALQWMVRYEAVKREAELSARLTSLKPEPAFN